MFGKRARAWAMRSSVRNLSMPVLICAGIGVVGDPVRTGGGGALPFFAPGVATPAFAFAAAAATGSRRGTLRYRSRKARLSGGRATRSSASRSAAVLGCFVIGRDAIVRRPK